MKEKALELLNMFYNNGYEAYVVGGFVRDMLLKKESYDIDIATNATPKDIKEIFKDVKLPGFSYGSVSLIYKKTNFEITTYRMDLEYKDKRKPSKIIYTDKLIIDLKRRDFTINTLCMDKYGNVIDLLNAMPDWKDTVSKTVGNANDILSEDALRILRAIRFATTLDFKLDKDLKDAIINNKDGLNDLSYFRKKQELNKIFSSPNVLKGIDLLKRFNLDAYLGINIDKKIVKTDDPIGIWAQVSPSDKYQFTNNEKSYLNAISKVLKDGSINDIELYKNGNYVCYIAAQILNIDKTSIYDKYDNLPIKKQEDIKISKKEIIDILNLSDKSILKDIIKDLEMKILLRKLDNNHDVLLKYIIDKYKNSVL